MFWFSTIRLMPMLIRRSTSLSTIQLKVAFGARLRQAGQCINYLAAKGIAICSNGSVRKLSNDNRGTLLKEAELTSMKSVKVQGRAKAVLELARVDSVLNYASQRERARTRALQNPVGGLFF